jgi:hypothetical protein
MTPRIRVVRAALLGVIAAAGAVFGIVACVAPPNTQLITDVYFDPNGGYAPSYHDFVTPAGDAGGSAPYEVLAVRCGDLDCHGQIGRPLRIFSMYGLRGFDAATQFTHLTGSNSDPITDDEKMQTYEAVIGLEPEVMQQVVSDSGVDVDKLLLFKKPLGTKADPPLGEGHKGGSVFTDKMDPGYLCLASWIGIASGSATALDQDSCNAGARR